AAGWNASRSRPGLPDTASAAASTVAAFRVWGRPARLRGGGRRPVFRALHRRRRAGPPSTSARVGYLRGRPVLPAPTHPPMSVLAVGTVAFDSIETPFGKAERILGGSGTYIALAARYLAAPVRLVGVVGRDFPEEHVTMLRERSIDTEGLVRDEG